MKKYLLMNPNAKHGLRLCFRLPGTGGLRGNAPMPRGNLSSG